MLFIIIIALVFLVSSGLCISSEITAIILPLSSTVWVPGKQSKVTYRVLGKPNGQAFEIDLVTGDPDNAQLVYIFKNSAVPESEGINSVTVDVPDSVSEGKYGIRIGSVDGNYWKYSQIFSISSSAPTSKSHSSKNIPDKKTSDKEESSGSSDESDEDDDDESSASSSSYQSRPSSSSILHHAESNVLSNAASDDCNDPRSVSIIIGLLVSIIVAASA
ncbi:hypothetical protein LPJ64_000767 [Coemansia asiatica]|uniref:Uncharacterized protein n=1 Tax=Coemansia asiatica TaxID=1052880 RepID=A0A9W8CM36_9FUNG|nr:hypothetical protein LPJ64_000767 [Coemansia asiatica]